MVLSTEYETKNIAFQYEPKVSREYLLKCTHCEQVFSGQNAIRELKEHLSHAHKEAGPPESNYTCQKCNASLASKENLAKHKLIHATNGQETTGLTDEELRKFKCPECGKGFKFKHHLKEHLRIHSGEKPFACGNCGKRFSHSGSFSSHNTSKKCLIVNLKMRKGDTRSSRGRGTTQTNSFRPIIPKYRSSGASPTASDVPSYPPGTCLLPNGSTSQQGHHRLICRLLSTLSHHIPTSPWGISQKSHNSYISAGCFHYMLMNFQLEIGTPGFILCQYVLHKFITVFSVAIPVVNSQGEATMHGSPIRSIFSTRVGHNQEYNGCK
ncbi:zinc finger E-box-binding homeobox 2 [Trichonephila clavipes]|nr:zinc finger E-box-binding homeobox 2 [Trichonephila clavipes]